ncbi:MAG: cell envelope biogenesis protein OmpA [Geobacteraceae bacterium GWC2_53_11]|nr:MAG: cell envelope biogenesis protein OmpA [Geobacteraceae bacterium GWC2_53_11]
MKKSALAVVAVLSLLSAGVASAELNALKGIGKDLGKEAGKSVAAGANEKVLSAITKKLKKVQNDKGPIKFKTGKAEIDPSCDKTMTAIASIMSDYPGFHVQVDGHTDNVGNPEANKKLSQERADAVVKYLAEKKNVDVKRLSAKGFGDSKPIADNKSKKGQAKNRRVDFTVTQM